MAELNIANTVDNIAALRVKYFGYTITEAHERRPSSARPTNDEFFMHIAGVVSRRSTCARRAVGCVLVDKHNNILSTGYNSVASGLPHCHTSNCPGATASSGTNLHLCEARHAEDVALMKCRDIYAIHTVYCTTEPCVHCTRRLLDTSAVRVVFVEPYPTTSSSIWTSTGRVWEQLT